MKRGTDKPCPLCKEPGNRPVDDVCTTCRRRWEELQKLESDLKAREGVLLFNIDAYPYIRHGRAGYHCGYNEVQSALAKVAKTLSHGTRRHQYWNNRDAAGLIFDKKAVAGVNSHDVFDQVWYTQMQADALNELYSAICRFGDGVYTDAYNDGRNILTGLIQGEITTNEFDKNQ